MKKIVLGLLSIALLAGCSSSSKSNATTIASIQESGVLIVGTSPDYPPFEFYDALSGEIVGFDISIAQAIADDLGVELEIKEMAFDMLVESVKSGHIDMVLSGMSPTETRQKVISFSDIYFSNAAVLLVKKDQSDNFNTPEKLQNAVIGAQMGSIQSDTVDQALVDGLIKDVKKMSVINELVKNLETGSVDGVLMSEQVAKQHIAKNPKLQMVEIDLNLEIEGMAIAFAKGSDELVNHVNELLNIWEGNGSMLKWMDEALKMVNQ